MEQQPAARALIWFQNDNIYEPQVLLGALSLAALGSEQQQHIQLAVAFRQLLNVTAQQPPPAEVAAADQPAAAPPPMPPPPAQVQPAAAPAGFSPAPPPPADLAPAPAPTVNAQAPAGATAPVPEPAAASPAAAPAPAPPEHSVHAYAAAPAPVPAPTSPHAAVASPRQLKPSAARRSAEPAPAPELLSPPSPPALLAFAPQTLELLGLAPTYTIVLLQPTQKSPSPPPASPVQFSPPSPSLAFPTGTLAGRNRPLEAAHQPAMAAFRVARWPVRSSARLPQPSWELRFGGRCSSGLHSVPSCSTDELALPAHAWGCNM